METDISSFSAAPTVLGYLFQCRYALFESLCRLRKGEEFIVYIETLDDVVFEGKGEPYDLLQTKHHINSNADLTDASPDLWKSFRVWSEGIATGIIPKDSKFFLITTSSISEGSASYYLRPGDTRDIAKANERLLATAESSTSKKNAVGYSAFRNLSVEQKKALLESTFILNSVPDINNLDYAIKEQLFYSVHYKYLGAFIQRLEGWWLRRIIKQLSGSKVEPILSQELITELDLLREQFREDSLPIDDDILSVAVDGSGYMDSIFVRQLNLIEINKVRIFHAIRNYFRAFKQRSRWIGEDLLLIGDLDQYEDRLVEEWELQFEQMRDELGDDPIEEERLRAAQMLYKWVESSEHPLIKPGCTEPFVARGTYQILSNSQRVGWHIEFVERLKQLLEPEVSNT